MNKYYGCDAHKKYSIFTYVTDDGSKGPIFRVENSRSEFRDYLETLSSGVQIAVESVGDWYWMIDEIERAGHIPLLTHAGKAKMMMGQLNKTDKLDAQGLATLVKNKTLPSVWIPPGDLRDQRELPRMRIALARMKTMLKNRIHATLAKYAIKIEEVTDVFTGKGRIILKERIQDLPPQTRKSVIVQLKLLDQVVKQIQWNEGQIEKIIE